MERYQAGYPACAGSDEEPGANYAPPTMGSFMRRNNSDPKRLRESRAASTVINEARSFHEKQAHRYGVDTNRGIAHFKASKMYAREGKLQEMLDQMNGQSGGAGDDQLNELPPKAVMKAHKSAAKFHKQQADKAGLDSDLGHAHVAAMEQHLDTFKKAKNAHQQSKAAPPKQPKQQKGEKQQMSPQQTQVPPTGTMPNVNASKKEAAGGFGSKQAPMPVPKKSQMKNGDIKDPSKPPVKINPQEANKGDDQQGTRLVSQKSETMGAHAGMIKASKKPNIESRLRAFESDANCVKSAKPSSVRDQMDDDLVFKGKRQKMHSGTAAFKKNPGRFTNESTRRRSL